MGGVMKSEPNEIGCRIHGVDVNAMSEGQLQELKQALYRNRIVVLKDQSIDERGFCDFARRFGFPEPYLQGNYHHPEYPLIFVSSNIKQNGRPMGVARTGGYWHSDTSFEPTPKVITMLLPKVLPAKSPRTTRFIDMSAVYAALPEAVRTKIENAEFIHSGRWRYKVRPEDAGLDISEILELIDHHAPPVRHPAVLVHPYTGDRAVYGTRGFTVGIAGMTGDESTALLTSIFDLAESPRFVREVQWVMGDLIIWDNRYLAHSSGRKKAIGENIHEEVKKEEETMMYRITLRDGYPLSASPADAQAVTR
jgi:taurine dioxygenase